MKPTPTLFRRGPDDLVVDDLTPGCEWVMEGHGVATRQWDGLCCMVTGGRLFRRHVVDLHGTAPATFERLAPDERGRWIGWVPVTELDVDHLEAWDAERGPLPNGTYELCGPEIHGNPEGVDRPVLIRHGAQLLDDVRDFEGLRAFLSWAPIEGVVWHHPGSRFVKLKSTDFGIERPT